MPYLIIRLIENEHRDGKKSWFQDSPDLNFVRDVDIEELGGLGRTFEQFSRGDVALFLVASRKIKGRIEGIVCSVAELEQGPTGGWLEP